MSALCLVPTSLRAARAARRLCDAEGGVLFGARVCTPEALAPDLLAGAGDGRVLLTPLAERLLAAEAGRAVGGSFEGLEPWDGLASALASAIAELRSGEVTAAQARSAAARMGGEGGRLALVAAALEVYEARLRELGALDRPGALRAAVEAVPRGAAGALGDLELLVLDGFAAMAPAALDLVSALAHRARRTHSRVPLLPERPDLCVPAEALLRRLEGLHALSVNRDVTVALDSLAAGGERLPRLAAVLATVAGGPGPAAVGGGITVQDPLALDGGGLVLGIAGAGPRGEADAVAALVARWTRGDGLAQARLSGEPRPADDGRRAPGAAPRILPEEVLLFSSDPARDAEPLVRAFAEWSVPLSIGAGEELSALPPVRALRDALRAASSPGRAALERLARSPYLGLAPLPPRLGELLDRAGALEGRGEPVQALRLRAATLRAPEAARERASSLRAADALDALRAAAGRLAGPGLPRAHASRIHGFLLASGARRRAARAELPLALHDLAALARAEEVADELARALELAGQGAATLDCERWAGLYDLALRGGRMPPPSEVAADAAELWPLSEAPGLSGRACVVMGCGRGSFPAPGPGAPLLRDPEREALREATGRAALPVGGERRSRALHTAFCALSAGREALALSWPGPGPEGGGEVPAPLAVEALLSAGAEVPKGPAAGGAAAARSPRARLAAAARRFRRAREGAVPGASPGAAGAGAAAGSGATAEACSTLAPGTATKAASAAERGVAAEAGAAAAPLTAAGSGSAVEPGAATWREEGLQGLGSALARGALEWERLQALTTGVESPALGLIPPVMLAELDRALPAAWTPSQLEVHARCPYRLLAGLVLRLQEPEAVDLDQDPRDEGSLAHAVLERLYRTLLQQHAFPLRGAEGEGRALLEAAEATFRAFEAAGRSGDPATWPGRRAAVLARLRRVLAEEAGRADAALPALLEYRFGGEAEEPPLTLGPPGAEVRLRGRVDRVDAAPERLSLLDYKDSRSATTWKQKLAPQALGVTSFQVPTYLLAAARALPGRPQLEASYLLLRSAERLPPLVLQAPGAPAAVAAPGPLVPRLVEVGEAPDGWAPRFGQAVVEVVRSVRQGRLGVKPTDCEGCPYGALCRVQGRGEPGA